MAGGKTMIYSKPCEYAIRALTYLAGAPDEQPAQAKDLARAENIPAPVLAKILQELARRGLLHSRRGPGGGFSLARRPELITLRDVVAVIDGLEHFQHCVAGLEQCNEEAPCPLHHNWRGVRAQILHDLETTTLAQMAQAVARKRALARRGRRGKR
jgi:Rrf2 family protein